MAFDAANPFGQGGDPYQGLRNKAQQDAGNAQSQNLDAMTRRFAAMGNLNSGAYVQAQQNAGREASQQAQDQTTAINMGEQQAAIPYAQMKQQEDQFGRQLGQQKEQFEKELPMKQRQLDLEASQQGLDSAANATNAELAKYQEKHSGGLLGGGGFLGTGL